MSKQGFKHSDETRRKMSIAHQGFKHSDETRRKMSIAVRQKEFKHSDETRRKMSAAKRPEVYGPLSPRVWNVLLRLLRRLTAEQRAEVRGRLEGGTP